LQKKEKERERKRKRKEGRKEKKNGDFMYVNSMVYVEVRVVVS